MRARDVSRPTAQDLAEAAEREDALGRPRGSASAETTEAMATIVSAQGRGTEGTRTDGTAAAGRPGDEVVTADEAGSAGPAGPVGPVGPVGASRRRRRGR